MFLSHSQPGSMCAICWEISVNTGTDGALGALRAEGALLVLSCFICSQTSDDTCKCGGDSVPSKL